MSITITPAIYTTAQLNIFKGNLVNCINDAGNAYYKGTQFGYCASDYYPLFRKMIRAYYLLNTWQQSANGSTYGYTNGITQTQLTATVMWVKQKCNC